MDGREQHRERAELHDPHVPRFPVIFKEPTPQQVRDNIRQQDCIQSAVLGIVSFPLGNIVGTFVEGYYKANRPSTNEVILYNAARQLDRSLARPGMWFTGIIGSIGGVLLAYQNSQLRLQGFGRNDDEVARYTNRESSHKLILWTSSFRLQGYKANPVEVKQYITSKEE
ncbi:hypothetical protein BBO99_00009085 [Phytophthora kernoviae]|uniref:NADH-ubiquinone oxidoreductase 21kDa subunit N-terminal domain-containing protein n=1 Tax=Phytophthora kernoviae TaxID=325452 RepID=A0A3R7MPL4_9STRA|nr:hypothetical protein BBI17_008644 [Phytophthora kernoviae]RLN74136.1 hypothetical protein BBO99_00009085 [Phytophthora kernoviae]